MQIYRSLSDQYLRVRVSVLRNWVQYVVECEHQSPWRTHWPQSRDDDRIMSDFLVLTSMRYTNWDAVSASKMHVVEFHRGFLAVAPPPLPLTEWILLKMKLTMAKETPAGRRLRPGLTREGVSAICEGLWKAVQGTSDDRLKRKYVNVGAAVSASWEKAIAWARRAQERASTRQITGLVVLSKQSVIPAQSSC